MKIRNGFVSNSSSSSFIIIGKTIDVEDIKKYPNVVMVGEWLSDGRDIIELTDDIKEAISNDDPRHYQYCNFIESELAFGEEGNLIKEMISKLHDKNMDFEIFTYERDYHCTEGLEDFIDRYSKTED